MGREARRNKSAMTAWSLGYKKPARKTLGKKPHMPMGVSILSMLTLLRTPRGRRILKWREGLKREAVPTEL